MPPALAASTKPQQDFDYDFERKVMSNDASTSFDTFLAKPEVRKRRDTRVVSPRSASVLFAGRSGSVACAGQCQTLCCLHTVVLSSGLAAAAGIYLLTAFFTCGHDSKKLVLHLNPNLPHRLHTTTAPRPAASFVQVSAQPLSTWRWPTMQPTGQTRARCVGCECVCWWGLEMVCWW